MKNAVLLFSLLVLAACTSSALPTSGTDPTAGKQSSPSSATAAPQQGRTEVPHGNTKMDGPPGY
jgi:hypothetical protein